MQYRMVQVLKILKLGMKVLNGMYFQHISIRVAQMRLKEAQKVGLSYGTMDAKYKEIQQAASRLSDVEHSFCLQHAKLGYFRQVGRTELPTSCLHFGQFIQAARHDQLVRLPMRRSRKQLFDIGDQHASSSDGYGLRFFKQAWDTIGRDFSNAVLEFVNNGKLLKKWNHTLISLVPKSSHASKVMDYRPISRCRVLYKVISKLLSTNIMDKFLHHKLHLAFQEIQPKEIVSEVHYED
ncbi:uncharacterized protein LOC122024061 [Zingiber officinale]|uniref:uncharacterized protein LOC122024061 n=1 Tax=Zingiber officinale TaxID=94328 RepID=UPI001C4C7E1D|nr:uncharacterized protein LOC122024061 [Zingiber officinale]